MACIFVVGQLKHRTNSIHTIPKLFFTRMIFHKSHAIERNQTFLTYFFVRSSSQFWNQWCCPLLPKYKNSLCMKESSIVKIWFIELKSLFAYFLGVFWFLFYDDQQKKIGQFTNICPLINLQSLFDDFNLLRLLLILFDYWFLEFCWVWVWANVCLDVWERLIIIINELIGCVL